MTNAQAVCQTCKGWGVGNVNDYSLAPCPECGVGSPSIPNYCKPCGENLLPEQVKCPFCGQMATPLDEIILAYRGWSLEPFRKPDGCFYAYAPDYDGTVPWHTACGKTRKALRAEIDAIIEDRGLASADTSPASQKGVRS